MKSVFSTTYDDKYLFFLPIVTWCWNKLNVDVICFMPHDLSKTTYPQKIGFGNDEPDYMISDPKLCLIINTFGEQKLKWSKHFFKCPKHKEATYAQCSRLYAAALDLPENEVLISSDVDMALLNNPLTSDESTFSVIGRDLTPVGQVPMCYLSGMVKDWREIFDIGGKTYQQCLDNLLGTIEAKHFRGNFWSKDQEEASFRLNEINKHGTPNPKNIRYAFRSNGRNQFATKRYDRDDAYILERLSPDTIDYHLPRPGYEENNFQQIMTILKYHYPNESLDWLVTYRNEYLKLL